MSEPIKKKILVVDDEPKLRLLLSKMLEKQYSVLEACNGDEAINIARAQKPALILLDIMMPVRDGYTTLNNIKADRRTRDIPVIMVTAVDYELNARLSKSLGAEGFLAKPFSYQSLHDTVARFLG